MVRRASPNDTGKRTRQKMPLASFPDGLFCPRARFWSTFGPHLAPKMDTWDRLSADFRGFLGHCCLTCGFSLHKGAWEGSWNRFWVSRGSSRMVLGRILLEFVARVLSKVWSKFRPHFRSVGVPSSVLPLTRPAHKLKGRRSRGAL